MLALLVIAGVALIAGLWLWLPQQRDANQRANLGQGLLSGAVVAAALAFVQYALDQQAAHSQAKAAKRERLQSLRLSTELSPDLTGVTLARQDLRHFFLVGKRLRQANLSGADLRNANLATTNLSGANLQHAHLAGALLRQADLDGAYLTRANMRHADLEQASLRYAVLREANLAGGRAIGARMLGADLRTQRSRRACLMAPTFAELFSTTRTLGTPS
jgi:uncharacterized protein YjbI with pentapeptide repeats